MIDILELEISCTIFLDDLFCNSPFIPTIAQAFKIECSNAFNQLKEFYSSITESF